MGIKKKFPSKMLISDGRSHGFLFYKQKSTDHGFNYEKQESSHGFAVSHAVCVRWVLSFRKDHSLSGCS